MLQVPIKSPNPSNSNLLLKGIYPPYISMQHADCLIYSAYIYISSSCSGLDEATILSTPPELVYFSTFFLKRK